MSTYYLRFVGTDELPKSLSEFDVQQFFYLTPDEIAAIHGRFRADRRLGPALQLVFLRASGRPLDRFSVVPKTLLHYVSKELGLTATSIASLRTIYKRRETLYDHQRWARERLGLRAFDDPLLAELRQELKAQAKDAACVDDLVKGA